MPGKLDKDAVREHVLKVVMERVDTGEDSRRQALSEFLAVTVNPAEGMAERMAELVPPLVPELYEKWAGMFVDRLLETLPENQLQLVCDGSKDNDASLVLAFLMFLESERMERRMEADLVEYGRDHAGDNDMGDAVAQWLSARKAEMASHGAPRASKKPQ